MLLPERAWPCRVRPNPLTARSCLTLEMLILPLFHSFPDSAGKTLGGSKGKSKRHADESEVSRDGSPSPQADESSEDERPAVKKTKQVKKAKPALKKKVRPLVSCASCEGFI